MNDAEHEALLDAMSRTLEALRRELATTKMTRLERAEAVQNLAEAHKILLEMQDDLGAPED